MKELVRLLPAVHELQKSDLFLELIHKTGFDEMRLTRLLKSEIQQVRSLLLKEEWEGALPGTEEFTSEIFKALAKKINDSYGLKLKRVINATGTILHTNLGRARLSDRAIHHVVNIARNYSNLEYRLEEGERGSRHDHIEQWICDITGAEAAMVVNNNAAAVYLILRALAKEKEVIVSRGQLVEIGGSFRISSIMEESGAKLVEVGTTNKTHLYDYEQAISEHTAILMKVHTSNFRTIGFTKTVSAAELAILAAEHEHLLFYEDLGSGVLFDLAHLGVGDEPVVKEVISKGADLVSFSGDKLLGGPQAGIIAGKKRYIDKLKKHQLARVLRVDKMTLAALEATLLDYVKGDLVRDTNPALSDILAEPEELFEKASVLCEAIQRISKGYTAIVTEDKSTIGGGTMPGVELETYGVSVTHPELAPSAFHKSLRLSEPAIAARIIHDRLFFDVRTLRQEELAEVVAVLKNL
ncbi:L-seryl-tRNA(Sec) selenium transferase [Peribacillus deserti]|uniref:L-seryl-tRNA(Sec) selenium transferase n=1 Tax=Peribacillus deserti TaxID=673318 RepID=A0A2N5M4Q9_9BACI|nr:L-seryl-tRNA(Sec) selenium transferase [Peribacillus deserti]PLT29322.1 L-seryl-tRNA(Sec) selenium transferase [Peribacillus deserti]